MNNEKLVRVTDSTWYIDATVSIPVFFLNSREVVMIDSGYADRDRDLIDNVLAENGLSVKAAIASHCHVDHVGNFQWLGEQYGAELIVPETEKWILADPAYITYLYRPVHACVLTDTLKHIFFEPDRSYSKDETEITICGEKFHLIYAPGHTIGHSLIVTPDDVCYLGDAVLGETMLSKSKMITCNDWVTDSETKKRLKQLNYSKYILAHSGLCEDLNSLIDRNNKKKTTLAETVTNILKTREKWTLNEIEMAYYKAMDMHAYKSQPMSIYRRNLTCLIEYLIAAGVVQYSFNEGTMVYTLYSK